MASAMVLMFVGLFTLLRIVDRGREVLQITGDAVSLMRDPDVTDLEKEKRIQKYSLRLLALFMVLVLAASAALLIPILTVWVLDRMSLVDFEGTVRVSTSQSFLVGASLVSVGLFWLIERLGKRHKQAGSRLD